HHTIIFLFYKICVSLPFLGILTIFSLNIQQKA
ncbi:hypothetical protein MJL32_21370, partial [Salmonella enterica subsp. enterica serovar Montevideo]|nr:hypothetical protein [Salmonella enterica subsp. enterica serovar Montevideo]